MKKLTIEEYIFALEKMKEGSRDRIGILGELGVTGIGTLAGIAASGSIAAAAGGSTLAGSSTLASIAGGIFVTTTPVGWVVGTAVAGGCLAYALSKLVGSGAKSDMRTYERIRELEDRIQKLKLKDIQTGQIKERLQQYCPGSDEGEDEKIAKVLTGLQLLVQNKCISMDDSTKIICDIEKKKRTVEGAFEAIEKIAREKSKCDNRIINS